MQGPGWSDRLDHRPPQSRLGREAEALGYPIGLPSCGIRPRPSPMPPAGTERRLAGAILAQERMALTSISLEVHAIASDDAQKAFRDAA
jgi:hypothetical protein